MHSEVILTKKNVNNAEEEREKRLWEIRKGGSFLAWGEIGVHLCVQEGDLVYCTYLLP